jgi:hypothetical protein
MIRPALHAGLVPIYSPRMKVAAMTIALLACAVLLGACGSQEIQLAKTSPYYKGAALFLVHCSG